MSARPSGGRSSGADRDINLLPIIGGVLIGAGILTLLYIYSRTSKSEQKDNCPRISLKRRKFLTKQEERDLDKQLKREEEERLKKLQEEMKNKQAKAAEEIEVDCGARDGSDIRQWLPVIGGVLIGAGILSVLYLFRKPHKTCEPRTLTIEADSPRDLEFGPTEYEECTEEEEECQVKIHPQRRRWPTLDEEQEEKRLREERKQIQEEEKRKRQLMQHNITRTMTVIATLMKQKT